MDYINIGLGSYTIILLTSTVSFIAGSNINCDGKAFHCVNSTHFKICVDLGSGVSMTVDEFLIPCPRNTVCEQNNLFECEYELTTTLQPVTIQSEVTNEQFLTSVMKQLDVTTIFPTKQQQGMELSEKYFNKVNATPASFTSNFLTDVLINSSTSSITKDLNTSNSGIVKTLNISRSNNKESAFSTTQSGIEVKQTLPYSANKLVPDIGVNTIYNTEISITEDRKTINSINSKSSKPLNQNNLDFDMWSTVTKKPDQVSSLVKLPYLAKVTLLPGNLSDPSSQENTPRISNVTHLIKSDNMSQERNLDPLIMHNMTQTNKSDNNTLYHNTNTDELNLTTLNVITDENFTSVVSNDDKKTKINSVITPELSTQYLAEATTSNYPNILNTADAIETFLNEGINNTNNLEKIRLNADDFTISTSIIPETLDVKTNETFKQMTKFGLNYALDNNTTTVLVIDDNNNVITTEISNNSTADKNNGAASLKPLSDLILKNETWPEAVAMTGETGINNNNITTTETTNNITSDNYHGVVSFKPLSDLISKNETRPEPVFVIGVTKLDNNNITAAETSNNITAEKYDGVTNLKPKSDLISNNETWAKPITVKVATIFYNNNITTTKPINNITEKISEGVTSLKPLSDLISKKETWPETIVGIGEIGFEKTNTPTSEISNNITADNYNGAASLKPLSDSISKNETWPEPVAMTGETGINNNNITTTETSKNITAEKYEGVTSMKPKSDSISKNESWSKPITVTVATNVNNNKITTTKPINNITLRIPDEVTSLKPLSDLNTTIGTWPEPLAGIGEIGLEKTNVTTTEISNNITADKYNIVVSLKPLSDLISKNETWPEPVVVIGEIGLEKTNVTTNEISNTITSVKYNGVASLKPLSYSISKNETWPEPVAMTGEIGINNNNITTTETSKNITAEKYERVTSMKPKSDSISKNESWSKPITVTVATNVNNNKITITKPINNITLRIPDEVTSLKPLSDLNSTIGTWPKPVAGIGEIGLEKTNVTTTEISNNITADKYNVVASMKPLSDLISKNESWPEPNVVIGETGLDNNNITINETSNTITSVKYNGVASLKPLSDLISKNETWTASVVMVGETGINNNNITTTETSKNITAEKYEGVTKSDSILKKEPWPKQITVKVAKDVANNNITTTKPINNITERISEGVTSLKPLSDIISKKETWPEQVVEIGKQGLESNNITTTETSTNITAAKYNGVVSLKPFSDLVSKNESWPKPIMKTVATYLDNNNMSSTTEPSNNTTIITYPGLPYGVTNLTYISDIIPTTPKIQPPESKLLLVIDSLSKDNIIVNISSIFNDHQTLDEEKKLSKFTKINDDILISSTDLVISDLKQNTTLITTRLETTLDKPITLTDRNAGVLGNTNSVNNSLHEIKNVSSSNSTPMNKISFLYETRTQSDTASITVKSLTSTDVFESLNSMDVTNNTLAISDELAEHTVVSVVNNSKIIKNTFKLESKIAAKPSTYLVSNTSNKQVRSSDTKTVLTSESAKKDMNKTGIINKNTNNDDHILGKNSFGNLNLTLSIENHLIPKLVTSNNFSLSPTVKITNTNNNISDKNNKSLKDIEVKPNRVTNNIDEKSLTVINNNLNYTDNVAPLVSSDSISIPSSLTKQLSIAIYNVNRTNVGETLSPTLTLDKAIVTNKHNETEYKKSSQINQNAPVAAKSNIEHEGKETNYLLLNPYKQVDTKTIGSIDTTRTLKEIYYNISEPFLTVRNNVKGIFSIDNITRTSDDKNTAPKHFYDIKSSSFKTNTTDTTTNKLVNISNNENRLGIADYFPLNEIPKTNISRSIIKPLLITQEPLEKVNYMSNLNKDKENSSLITENGVKEHISDRLNISKMSEINNVLVNNITSSNNFSKDKINNLEIVNTMIVAKPIKTFTYDRNVSGVKSLFVLRTKENYTNALNSTSKSSITTNNLLRNTLSQTNSIKNNKTPHILTSNTLELSKIPTENEKSSQTTGPSDILFIRPKLDLISEQDKITTSEPPGYINTNRSNGIKQQQLKNGQGLYLDSIGIIANGVTKNIGNNPQNSSTATINNTNYSDTKYGNVLSKRVFICTNRGKYSDTSDCNKFYICIGRVKPIIGLCPPGTVFSEYLKQCTKNITHCIRNNQFKCTAAGRFISILCNNTYFICAKKKSSFIRFTLKCQKGYYLDKYNIKCTPKFINISISDENNSKNRKELSHLKEMEGVSVNSKNVFECEKEGKFKDPQDCRKYFICKKGRKSTFRRKIIKCDSDEVFHGKKKKCVDEESYECNI